MCVCVQHWKWVPASSPRALLLPLICTVNFPPQAVVTPDTRGCSPSSPSRWPEGLLRHVAKRALSPPLSGPRGSRGHAARALCETQSQAAVHLQINLLLPEPVPHPPGQEGYRGARPSPCPVWAQRTEPSVSQTRLLFKASARSQSRDGHWLCPTGFSKSRSTPRKLTENSFHCKLGQ